jgi:hypothetical protein
LRIVIGVLISRSSNRSIFGAYASTSIAHSSANMRSPRERMPEEKHATIYHPGAPRLPADVPSGAAPMRNGENAA